MDYSKENEEKIVQANREWIEEWRMRNLDPKLEQPKLPRFERLKILLYLFLAALEIIVIVYLYKWFYS